MIYRSKATASTLSGPMDKQVTKKIKTFSGKAPLLPLSNIVFFPKTFLPLHVFEPRYRTLLADVEKSEGMICMVLLKPGWEDDYKGRPPIHEMGTLGYVDYKKTHKDGTSDILLVGLTKVAIKEVPTKRAYRIGKLAVMRENSGRPDLGSLKRKIFQQFRRLADDERFTYVSQFFQDGLDFEMAVNLIAAHMPIETKQKQKLLELDDFSYRAKVLLQFMESEFRDLSSLPGDLRMN